MAKTYVTNAGLDEALKRFNRDFNRSGVMQNCKMHEYYMTRNERRKFKADLRKKKKK